MEREEENNMIVSVAACIVVQASRDAIRFKHRLDSPKKRLTRLEDLQTGELANWRTRALALCPVRQLRLTQKRLTN